MREYYWEVADAYIRIFKRMDLPAIITEASGGVFTDNFTHEFQIASEAGEDTIYLADGWKYAKNEEVITPEDRRAPGLRSIKTIEVGNIFPFGPKKYSELMGGMFTDHDGSRKPVWFASYGIGPTRVMGALVEVFHDERGILWPVSVAPYHVHLITINPQSTTNNFAEEIYNKLQEAGIEVLYDDREDINAGQKFTDADLIGNPVRLVISQKTAEKIEWKRRGGEKTELLTIDELFTKLKSFKRNSYAT
jgi:prolyl-tRNA synthetase